jgi:hypothetical protein
MGLLAMKGSKQRPRENELPGKLVMFTSSSGEESSGVYREKQHGFLTYFMLKKLKETSGNITYKDLGTYIKENVVKESTLESKPQTPQVRYSISVENEWEQWMMK